MKYLGQLSEVLLQIESICKQNCSTLFVLVTTGSERDVHKGELASQFMKGS